MDLGRASRDRPAAVRASKAALADSVTGRSPSIQARPGTGVGVVMKETRRPVSEAMSREPNDSSGTQVTP